MRVNVNGHRMFFDVEGASHVADGATMRERPTVLLLHGGPGFDHSSFKPAFGRLAEYAQVVYVDHSGQGRSDPTDPSRWTLAQWADDVAGLCEALGIERPIVLGWSFGGMVAQMLAGRHPNLPSQLLLLSTAPRLDLDMMTAVFERLGGPEAAATARAFWTDPNPESVAAYMGRCLPLYSPLPIDPVGMARAVMTPELVAGGWTESLTFDLRNLLASVICPTLILAGELDPVTPMGAAEEILAALPDGIGRLERFTDSGHFIPDTEPDRLFALLAEAITAG